MSFFSVKEAIVFRESLYLLTKSSTLFMLTLLLSPLILLTMLEFIFLITAFLPILIPPNKDIIIDSIPKIILIIAFFNFFVLFSP